MSDPPAHFCPGCGTEQRVFLRYPWYFCQDCRERVCDGAGRLLDFFNVSFSGGFEWRYRDDPDATANTCSGAVCVLLGRPVIAHEARFGGIVIEPWNSSMTTPKGYWRLTGDTPMAPLR